VFWGTTTLLAKLTNAGAYHLLVRLCTTELVPSLASLCWIQNSWERSGITRQVISGKVSCYGPITNSRQLWTLCA